MGSMMETVEIFPLTEDSVSALLVNRENMHVGSNGGAQRKAPRWPFPGTVELWIPGEDGFERHALATSINLSIHGMGVRCEEELPPGMELEIAIHEPEASFHGRAIIRHCTPIPSGQYMIGVQFLFS